MNVSVRGITRLAAVAALVATPLLTAQPAQAGVGDCQAQFITIFNIQTGAFVNCTLDTVGDCTYFYDPLFAPFPNNVAPETVEYVNCLA